VAFLGFFGDNYGLTSIKMYKIAILKYAKKNTEYTKNLKIYLKKFARVKINAYICT